MKRNGLKYYITTIGCQMNKSDSRRFAGRLEELGFSEASLRSEADLAVINTCGVRQSAEDRIYGLIPKIKKENPRTRILVTGCLSERKDAQRKMKEKVDLWFPIVELPELQEKIFHLFPRAEYKEGRGGERDYLKIPPKMAGDISVFIPVGNGCDNFCSYCVVPYARGGEVYRPASDILQEVHGHIRRGAKEVVLIAQNVNSYVSPEDSNFDFGDLLRKVDSIPGNFRIRFATSHPKDMQEKLTDVIAGGEKICPHIHLPVQAGDDRVLERMNRKYTARHYLYLIAEIRKKIPDVSLTTDIITGFPGETDEEFQNTKELLREASFDMAYIAQYSPRPGTAAARLEDDVPARKKKEREEELMEILRGSAYNNNLRYSGRVVRVLVEGRYRKGRWFGRTDTNKNVKIRTGKDTVLSKGEFVKVKIDRVRDLGLQGRVAAKEK